MANICSDNGHASDRTKRSADEVDIERLVDVLLEAAVSLDLSPRVSLLSDEHRRDDVLEPAAADRMAEGTPEVLHSPRKKVACRLRSPKFRFGLDEDGQPRPKLRCVTYAEALFEAMIHRFYEDPTMVAYGEENRDWGGAFGVYRGLDRSVALSSPLQLAHLRSGDCRHGGRLCAELVGASWPS